MRGFTFIEIIVVVAIISLLATFSLFMSMETFRGTLRRSEGQMVTTLLQKARSRALSNLSQSSWGVCYIAPNYVLFRGTACTAGHAENETVPANPVTPATFLSPVVFSALSATSTGGIITVVEGTRVSTTTVNAAGRIDW